jgi:predicted helicase
LALPSGQNTAETSGLGAAGDQDVLAGDPRYFIDLLARIVTVSLETMTIVDTLPMLDVLAHQPKE